MNNVILRDFSYIVSIIIEIGLPLIIAFIIWKKFKVSWAIFFLGMVLFLASLIRIPLNNYVIGLIRFNFHGENFIIMSALFVSLTAGLFEEGVRILAIGIILNFYGLTPIGFTASGFACPLSAGRLHLQAYACSISGGNKTKKFL